jgi:hypothetical protein
MLMVIDSTKKMVLRDFFTSFGNMHADSWIPGILQGYCHPAAVLEHAIPSLLKGKGLN